MELAQSLIPTEQIQVGILNFHRPLSPVMGLRHGARKISCGDGPAAAHRIEFSTKSASLLQVKIEEKWEWQALVSPFGAGGDGVAAREPGQALRQ